MPVLRRVRAVATHGRSALTLVELLVVLAIIGVLIGLLLPAVQFARESARQTTCRNHLHQVGLALHAYHNMHRSLPIGCIDSRVVSRRRTSKNFAWSAALLPFIEQQSLHDSIDFGIPFDDSANALPASVVVDTYLCPTAPVQLVRRGPTQLGPMQRGPTHYGGLYGETLVDREQRDGVFLYNDAVAFRDCLDGLSQTMAVSEDVVGPHGEWINGNNVFVQSHGINDPSAWIFDNEIRSLHPGGATALFVDGSVHLIHESIDRQVLGSLITRAGREVVDASDLP